MLLWQFSPVTTSDSKQIFRIYLKLSKYFPCRCLLTRLLRLISGSQILVVGILQGLAGGTLLYITFFEVLEREKLEKIGMTGLMGCFLIILGFGLMAGLEAAGNTIMFLFFKHIKRVPKNMGYIHYQLKDVNGYLRPKQELDVLNLLKNIIFRRWKIFLCY